MVKTRNAASIHDTVKAQRRATTAPRPVGRPPVNGQAARRISLAPPMLRAWLATVQGALAQPRAASTAKALAALQADMASRLGPHADPAYSAGRRGPTGAQRAAWRVVAADGTDTTHPTLASAAKAYGAKPASLRTMLSRGGGRCQRTAYVDGAASQVTCEKLAR